MPVFFNLCFFQAILGYIYITIICYIVVEDFTFFSTSMETGCFGLFRSEQVGVMMGMYGPAHGFFGNAGYIVCLKYFSAVVVSAAFLFEPGLSQIIGYWFDIDEMPGWMTWLGAAGVFTGIALI